VAKKKKSNELFMRVLSGVVGGAGILALVIYGSIWGTHLLAALLSLGMIYEFLQMTLSGSTHGREHRLKVHFALALVGVISLFHALSLFPTYELLTGSFLVLGFFYLWTARTHKGKTSLQTHVKDFFASFVGLFYLGFLPLYLVWLRELDQGVHWTLFFLLVVWMADTGGYFFGKKWGKHKLYKVVSPGKSWEGYGGGLLFSLLVAWGYGVYFLTEVPLWKMLFLAFSVNVMAQVGDLCESLLKRGFDQKDSGSIIPGHGGFLDRFDAVVFSLPLMYVLVTRLV